MSHFLRRAKQLVHHMIAASDPQRRSKKKKKKKKTEENLTDVLNDEKMKRNGTGLTQMVLEWLEAKTSFQIRPE